MNKYFLMLQAGQKFLRKIRTKIRTLKKKSVQFIQKNNSYFSFLLSFIFH